MNKIAYFTIILLLLATNLLADDREKVLILGAVENNPKKEAAVLQPIVSYAAGKMADLGMIRGEILIAKTREELIAALKEGRVDWVTDTPFPVILMMEQTGAEILGRRWKSGVAEYASLFFVHKASPIQSLEELTGKAIAFGDLDSTTTYFVPLAELRQKGLATIQLSTLRDQPKENKVSFVFANDQANIFNWVQRRLVVAGVASTSDWEDAKEMQKDFKIIHQSLPLPRSVELVRKELDPKIKKRLQQVLLDANKDPGAKEALLAYKKTKKFDELQGDALAGLENARAMLNQIRDVLH